MIDDYCNGYDAYFDGKLGSANPYVKRSDRFPYMDQRATDWAKGYSAAMRDEREATGGMLLSADNAYLA